MRVTSRDLAAQLGVSQSTVSRALRDDPRVSPETRQRIAEAARVAGYTPNLTARSLITRQTGQVALVVSDITNPFYPDLVEVLHHEFSLLGYRTVLFDEQTDHSGDHLVPFFLGRSVDGVMFASATLGSNVVHKLVENGVPVVLVNRDVEGVRVDRVLSDNYGGGRLAAHHLVNSGHRRIGLILGPQNTSTSRDRERGFLAGLQDMQVPPCDEFRRVGNYTYENGYQWATDLLGKSNPPSALFCANDIIAFGALDAARRLGVRVPQQASIIGFDDVPMAGWEVFGLTTIRQNLGRMARLAARRLVDRISGRGESLAQTVIFPTQMIVRRTTASS